MARARPMTTALLVAGVVLGAYGFLNLFAWLCADALVFRPGPSSYRDGPRILKIPADDGVLLSALHLPVPGARWTVFFLHGNAEDLGDVLPRLEEFRRRGYGVLAFDYRGYGTTPGAPREDNVHRDTRAVFAFAQRELGLRAGDVVLFGRSLGSGPAVNLALREPVAGVVLEGAFTSAFRVVTNLPLLAPDRFNNGARLPRVRAPVLVIHGREDATIPFAHGPDLLARVTSRAEHLWVDGAGHNNVPLVAGALYWETLDAFVASLGTAER